MLVPFCFPNVTQIQEKSNLRWLFNVHEIRHRVFMRFGLKLGSLVAPKTPPQPTRNGPRGAIKRTKDVEFWGSVLQPLPGLVLDGFRFVLEVNFGWFSNGFWTRFVTNCDRVCKAPPFSGVSNMPGVTNSNSRVQTPDFQGFLPNAVETNYNYVSNHPRNHTVHENWRCN